MYPLFSGDILDPMAPITNFSKRELAQHDEDAALVAAIKLLNANIRWGHGWGRQVGISLGDAVRLPLAQTVSNVPV
jgi:hypothetical protein